MLKCLFHCSGDYAVLLQAGFSRCSALIWNFISATTAIIGFFVGAAVSTNETARQWIFAVTVGMFLYIALVDLVSLAFIDEEQRMRETLFDYLVAHSASTWQSANQTIHLREPGTVTGHCHHVYLGHF